MPTLAWASVETSEKPAEHVQLGARVARSDRFAWLLATESAWKDVQQVRPANVSAATPGIDPLAELAVV